MSATIKDCKIEVITPLVGLSSSLFACENTVEGEYKEALLIRSVVEGGTKWITYKECVSTGPIVRLFGYYYDISTGMFLMSSIRKNHYIPFLDLNKFLSICGIVIEPKEMAKYIEDFKLGASSFLMFMIKLMTGPAVSLVKRVLESIDSRDPVPADEFAKKLVPLLRAYKKIEAGTGTLGKALTPYWTQFSDSECFFFKECISYSSFLYAISARWCGATIHDTDAMLSSAFGAAVNSFSDARSYPLTTVKTANSLDVLNAVNRDTGLIMSVGNATMASKAVDLLGLSGVAGGQGARVVKSGLVREDLIEKLVVPLGLESSTATTGVRRADVLARALELIERMIL
jgi:hypothetical protein